MTTDTIKVQRLESREDLGALIAGDVVEIRDRDFHGEPEGDRRYQAVVFRNTKGRRELIMPHPDDKEVIRSYGYLISNVEVYEGAVVLEEDHVTISNFSQRDSGYAERKSLIEGAGL